MLTLGKDAHPVSPVYPGIGILLIEQVLGQSEAYESDCPFSIQMAQPQVDTLLL